MLDQKLAEAMQRALSRLPGASLGVNASYRKLFDQHKIGIIAGKTIKFSAKDHERMAAWLLAKGYPLDPVDLSGMTRGDVLKINPNEKAGGARLKENRVSIKSLPGGALLLGEDVFCLPDFGTMDIDWTKISDRVKNTCVMYVENYDNFNRIHECVFSLPDEYKNPLVIYGGDPRESGADKVLPFLAELNLPAMAFVDVDPSSIAMASRMRNLVGMVAPPADKLRSQLSETKRRIDLYHDQYANNSKALDALPESHLCFSIWALVKASKGCVMQENWFGEECILHDN